MGGAQRLVVAVVFTGVGEVDGQSADSCARHLACAFQEAHGYSETPATGLGGEMADSPEPGSPELAENLAQPTAAALDGSVVGVVQGLIWSDASGFDVLSVDVRDVHVAVPVESDTWRDADVVELAVSAADLTYAPAVQELETAGGIRAVELVADHFSMPLAGPPPGPPTGPLPPWWHKDPQGVKPDDDPAPPRAES